MKVSQEIKAEVSDENKRTAAITAKASQRQRKLKFFIGKFRIIFSRVQGICL